MKYYHSKRIKNVCFLKARYALWCQTGDYWLSILMALRDREELRIIILEVIKSVQNQCYLFLAFKYRIRFPWKTFFSDFDITFHSQFNFY